MSTWPKKRARPASGPGFPGERMLTLGHYHEIWDKYLEEAEELVTSHRGGIINQALVEGLSLKLRALHLSYAAEVPFLPRIQVHFDAVDTGACTLIVLPPMMVQGRWVT